MICVIIQITVTNVTECKIKLVMNYFLIAPFWKDTK
nr:MAG TPA: hypothetical protein [Caudoviricetes sp.]